MKKQNKNLFERYVPILKMGLKVNDKISSWKRRSKFIFIFSSKKISHPSIFSVFFLGRKLTADRKRDGVGYSGTPVQRAERRREDGRHRRKGETTTALKGVGMKKGEREREEGRSVEDTRHTATARYISKVKDLLFCSPWVDPHPRLCHFPSTSLHLGSPCIDTTCVRVFVYVQRKLVISFMDRNPWASLEKKRSNQDFQPSKRINFSPPFPL